MSYPYGSHSYSGGRSSGHHSSSHHEKREPGKDRPPKDGFRKDGCEACGRSLSGPGKMVVVDTERAICPRCQGMGVLLTQKPRYRDVDCGKMRRGHEARDKICKQCGKKPVWCPEDTYVTCTKCFGEDYYVNVEMECPGYGMDVHMSGRR